MRPVAAILLAFFVAAAFVVLAAARRGDARRRKGARVVRRSIPDALEWARRRPGCRVLVEFRSGADGDAALSMLDEDQELRRSLAERFECVRIDASPDGHAAAAAIAAKYGERSLDPKKLPLVLVLDVAGKHQGSMPVAKETTPVDMRVFLGA